MKRRVPETLGDRPGGDAAPVGSGNSRHAGEEATRDAMAQARAAMNEERWPEAATLLASIVRSCRARRAGHAEALWALAVCRDALGDEAAALALLDDAVASDPTALTPHETREALLERLRRCAADISAEPAARARAKAALAAREKGGTHRAGSRPRARARKPRRVAGRVPAHRPQRR